MTMPLLGTVSDVCRIFGMSEWAAYDFLKRNKHLRVKVGKKIFVNLEKLEKYVSDGGDIEDGDQ